MTRKLVNAKLKSIIDYEMPLFFGESETVLNKVESTYMLINWIIHWGHTFMTHKVKICKMIKADLPRQNMTKTAVKFLHNHILKGKCDAILDQLI